MSRRLLTIYNVIGYAFLLAPIAIVMVLSFSAGSSVSFPPPGLSLRWFRYLAGRDEFISSAIVSLEIAALASVGAVAMMWLRQKPLSDTPPGEAVVHVLPVADPRMPAPASNPSYQITITCALVARCSPMYALVSYRTPLVTGM